MIQSLRGQVWSFVAEGEASEKENSPEGAVIEVLTVEGSHRA